jgi:tRNA-dihydrouridine synthase
MLGKKQQAPTQLVPSIGKNGELAPRSAVPQRSCFPTLGSRREVIEKHLLRLVELNEASAKRRKNKYEPEAAACLTFRPHLAQYLKGLRGRRELMQQLNQMHDVQTVMNAVDKVMEQNHE